VRNLRAAAGAGPLIDERKADTQTQDPNPAPIVAGARPSQRHRSRKLVAPLVQMNLIRFL